MKTLAVSNKYSHRDTIVNYKDFSIAIELYKLSKSASIGKEPRLRANDWRRPAVEKKATHSIFSYLLEQSRQEILLIRRVMQKVFAFAHTN